MRLSKLNDDQRQEIFTRADAGERWSVIARDMGLKESLVYRALRRAGRTPNTVKAKIVALHKAEPHLNTQEIAARLNCSRITVGFVRNQLELSIPHAPNGPRNPRPKKDRQIDLGRAARAAGLTVAMIAEIAAQRGYQCKS